MQQFLKPFAILFKIFAIIFWLGIAVDTVPQDVSDLRATSQPSYRDAPRDWGTTAFYHRTYRKLLIIAVAFLLSVLPNRWLIFSPVTFAISLSLTFLVF